MKYFEMRRHSMRRKYENCKSGTKKPRKHLSQAGIDLARGVSEQMRIDGENSFHGVITSKKPRAIETALCFGFEVDVFTKSLGYLPEKIYRKSRWPADFASMSKAMKKHKNVAKYAKQQAEILALHIEQIEDGQTILGISHGGIMELMAMGALPDEEHKNWGAIFDYCEGFRLARDGDKWVGIEILRVT
jgi:broad specificity phosphatase PhoE